MKKIITSGIVCVLLFLNGICLYGKEDIRLKIMSYNIRMSGQMTGYAAQPFADFILQQDADIIALQEVDYNTARSNNKDFLTEIAALTGMFPLFGKAINTGGGEYGIAVLSKYPITSSVLIPLSAPSGTKEQRAALVCEIAISSSFVLKFASTHLDHSTEAVRMTMAQELNSSKVLYGNLPVLLGGDFNAKPTEGTITTSMAKWQRICDNTNTYPSETPTSKIDYLFGYPALKWNTVSYTTIHTGISDHRAIVAEVEYKP